VRTYTHHHLNLPTCARIRARACVHTQTARARTYYTPPSYKPTYMEQKVTCTRKGAVHSNTHLHAHPRGHVQAFKISAWSSKGLDWEGSVEGIAGGPPGDPTLSEPPVEEQHSAMGAWACGFCGARLGQAGVLVVQM